MADRTQDLEPGMDETENLRGTADEDADEFEDREEMDEEDEEEESEEGSF